ncbi:MAG TPA: type II CAAX endopeptidase family protein [bacterium]|nr:type II CAAX endopeptidase family protein [bacterium]HNT66442.1 type II CAAX endopeptidase family protein [bacterium]
MKIRFYSSIALAFGLWTMAFVWKPFNFWILMSASTLLLTAIAVTIGRPLQPHAKPTFRDFCFGVLAAVLLYTIFFAGRLFIDLLAERWPLLFGHSEAQIQNVYGDRNSLPLPLIALLLVFPIGFGEELFWRGLVQKTFAEHHSAGTAFIMATLLYTAVHLVTGNAVLLIAALVGGLFWGGIYWKTGNLWIPLISHMIWDPWIFVWMPVA